MTDPTPVEQAARAVDVTRAFASVGAFSEYRKTAITRISDHTFPPGTVYETPEGLRAEDEPTRCAVDVQGGVYPIRESVFQASYEPAALDAAPADGARLREALYDVAWAYHHEQDHPSTIGTCYEPRCQQAWSALAAPDPAPPAMDAAVTRLPCGCVIDSNQTLMTCEDHSDVP